MAYRPPPIGPKVLRFSASADADIDEIVQDLKRGLGLSVAQRLAVGLDANLARLARLGHAGISRDWISPGLRLRVFGIYSIYFRVTEGHMFVVRVLLGSRLLDPEMVSEQPTDGSTGGPQDADEAN